MNIVSANWNRPAPARARQNDGVAMPQSGSSSDANRPQVWDVYDEYRNMCLNRTYYSCRLQAVQAQNFWLEWILAVVAPSSAIAGFALWQTSWGKSVWTVISCVAALLAITKPLVKFGDQISVLEKRIGSYRALELDFESLIRKIRDASAYNDEHRKLFSALLDKKRDLIIGYVDVNISDRLRQKCRTEIEELHPTTGFFVPAEPTAPPSSAAAAVTTTTTANRTQTV